MNKETTGTTSIIVGHGTKHPRLARFRRRFVFLQRRWLLFLVGGLVLLAGGGALVYRVWYSQPATSSTTTKAKAEAALPGASLSDKINSALSSGKYDQALQLLQAQTPNNSTEVVSYTALVYYTKGDYQAALNTYAKLAKTSSLAASDADIAGSAAQKLKQYDQALQYYEQAKNLAQKHTANSMQAADVALYQAKIDQVKKLQ